MKEVHVFFKDTSWSLFLKTYLKTIQWLFVTKTIQKVILQLKLSRLCLNWHLPFDRILYAKEELVTIATLFKQLLPLSSGQFFYID